MKNMEASGGRSRFLGRWLHSWNGFEIWESYTRVFELVSLRQVPRRGYCYAKVSISISTITKNHSRAFVAGFANRALLCHRLLARYKSSPLSISSRSFQELQSMTYIHAFRSSAYIIRCFFSCPWVITYAACSTFVSLPQLIPLDTP